MTDVTVVIPTYNRAHLIRRAIGSVLSQTVADIGVVVVDDGSTDNTASVVAEYGSRVRYYRQDNAGVGAARNAGVARCEGRFIAFLDSDDYWFPFKTELQLRLIETAPRAAFIFSEFVVEKDDGRRQHGGSRQWLRNRVDWSSLYRTTQRARELGVQVDGAPADFPVYSGPMYRQFIDSAFVLPTTAIVRRDALVDTIRFTERVAIFEDWEFFARLSKSHEGMFVDVETAVNSGHAGPERVTRCSALAKAQSYLRVVRDVWKQDLDFMCVHGNDVLRAEARALMAVAHEALIAGDAATAGAALDAHAALTREAGRRAGASAGLALLYRLAARSGERGRQTLKVATLGAKLVRTALGHGHYPVNPAA